MFGLKCGKNGCILAQAHLLGGLLFETDQKRGLGLAGLGVASLGGVCGFDVTGYANILAQFSLF